MSGRALFILMQDPRESFSHNSSRFNHVAVVSKAMCSCIARNGRLIGHNRFFDFYFQRYFFKMESTCFTAVDNAF